MVIMMKKILLTVIVAFAVSLSASAEYALEHTGSDPCDRGIYVAQHHYYVYTVMPNGAPGRQIGYLIVDCDGVFHFTDMNARASEGGQFLELLASPLGRDYKNILRGAQKMFPEGVSMHFQTQQELDAQNAARAARSATAIE